MSTPGTFTLNDMAPSQIRYFRCNELGHRRSGCPNAKAKLTAGLILWLSEVMSSALSRIALEMRSTNSQPPGIGNVYGVWLHAWAPVSAQVMGLVSAHSVEPSFSTILANANMSNHDISSAAGLHLAHVPRAFCRRWYHMESDTCYARRQKEFQTNCWTSTARVSAVLAHSLSQTGRCWQSSRFYFETTTLAPRCNRSNAWTALATICYTIWSSSH